MRNNRAVFLPLYLAVLTVFMCGVVIGLFVVEQRNAENSLVSSAGVFEMRDGLEIYEMREVELIRSSLDSARVAGDFGEEAFEEEFRRIFLAGVWADGDMIKFLRMYSLPVGVVVDAEYLKNLYHESLTDIGSLSGTFGRRSAKKGRTLRAEGGREKIYFNIEFSYEFSKTYIITDSGAEFFVRGAGE